MTDADALANRLRQRGVQLAARLLGRVGAALTRRLEGAGVSVADQGGQLRLTGPDLRARRRGTRQRLPEPDLLWPDAGPWETDR